MEGDDIRPAKRLKRSQSTDTLLPPQFSTYIPIATANLDVQLLSSPDDTDVVKEPRSTLVEIKNVSALGSHVVLTVASKGRKPQYSVTASLHDQNAERTLAVCQKVESTLRASTKSKAHVVLAHTELHLSPDQSRLTIKILWQDTVDISHRFNASFYDLLETFMPIATETTQRRAAITWEPRNFYDNVHVPPKTGAAGSSRIQPLSCQLYPFQWRAVRWLLSREGVSLQDDGGIEQHSSTAPNAIPPGFLAVCDADDHQCYVNHALGILSSDLDQVQRRYGPIKGGILAEEVGLGKTVELLSLICLHPRTESGDGVIATDLQALPATLIITPPIILQQWIQETHQHAPHLRVYHYEGIKGRSQDRMQEILAAFETHDIVVTTYNVIAKEVHYVAEKPDRSLRSRPRVEPPKSPLTQYSWWRVCLDEAQMVESGVSAAATVARLIPRIHAWAVTGTPLRKNHRDLYGLFLFLRHDPWAHNPRLWDHLVIHHRPWFQKTINEMTIRHSKNFVREDLRLPPQNRHTITLPFSAIEEQHYTQLFHELCEDCHLDINGVPLSEDDEIQSPATVDKMRTWLTRLRQTCLHPEIGGRNRRALGRGGGPLRTVQQVLDLMIEQNEGLVRTEQRALLLSKIRRGQMRENAKATDQAMQIWREGYDESCQIVAECRDQLHTELKVRSLSNGSKKQTVNDVEVEDSDLEEEAEPDSTLQTLRQRLRSALEVQHICIFFIANAFYQLKSDETQVRPESEEFHALEKKETAAYDEAKSIRTEMLSEVFRKSTKLINKLNVKSQKEQLVPLPSMEMKSDVTGIESRRIFDKLDRFCAAMNEQAIFFVKIRQKMLDLLLQALIDQDEGIELQGDEYESSTKHQDEMYAYMEALRAAFADRSDAVSGQENLLIRQEVKQFLQSAKEGEGPAPELMLKLLGERDFCRVKPSEHGSLRGIVAEIRQLVAALNWQEAGGSTRAKAELATANQILGYAQQLVSTQAKSIVNLEMEVNQFRDTMNGRLDYYRALQKISDTVAPLYAEDDVENVGKPVDEDEHALIIAGESRTTQKVSGLLSKRRYLLHLKTESQSDTPRTCIICQTEFENGTLTVCGHQFCMDCIRLWYNEHKNCPVCKRRLYLRDFHNITYKPAELSVQAEASPVSVAGESSPEVDDKSARHAIYSGISTGTLNQIKNMDIGGASFGSKIDFLCRHILWLRDNDPGSKAIIFSQYREFLDVLGRALSQSRITYSRFDDKNGIEKFKSDASVECFLLHAKAHAAGLNLVVASHVILCEPLINTAIELQAIARVHRIGQHRTTTVWMYLISDTVEESIYEISVTRRLAHMRNTITRHGRNGSPSTQSKSKPSSGHNSGTATPDHPTSNLQQQENAIDAANSMELQAADLTRLLTSGKSGGEIVEKQDLWQCLFGKSRRGKGFEVEKNGFDVGGEEVANVAVRVMDQAHREGAASQIGRVLRVDAAVRRRDGSGGL